MSYKSIPCSSKILLLFILLLALGCGSNEDMVDNTNGDNLGDFHQDFFGKDNQDRWDATIKYKDDFGDKFILFPNLIYGNWEEGFEE